MAEPGGPLNSPGFWLHHAALRWRRELDSRLAGLGLTHTQFTLLASADWLAGQSVPVTQQEIADLAGADRMMTSKVLTALGERGLVLRSAHPSDARAKALVVTETGRSLVSDAVRIVAEIDEEIFGPMGAAREQLRGTLRAIASVDGR